MSALLDHSVFKNLHKREAWMYTNVSALADIDFQVVTAEQQDDIDVYDIAKDSPLVVFINGVFSKENSRLCKGASVSSGMNDSVSARGDSLIPRGVSDILTITGNQLNTIHVLQIISSATPVACFGNVLIHAKDSESISVAESHVATTDVDHLFMPCTEIIAEKNSEVTLVRSIRGSKQAYHLGTLHVEQHDSSKVQTHTITLGGKRTRNEVYAYLDGTQCESNFDGMYMLGQGQFVDNHLRIEHNMPNCNSREFYKGVLDEDAQSVFTGRIYVKEDAQQTDAKQTNQNILLSDDAQATSRPQLEIYADDVACTHGATTGEIDDEAMLYLRSRGIPADAARTLLIYAFLNESLDDLQDTSFRTALVEDLLTNLPGGAFIKELYL
ncbi:MAG: Fe-S cluster assembly protein SufD [Phycisphaerales bacterium]|jgi:Fe-S cluster assembly protein SufD|nr:Fe-S cluster assembly protein SufD [Phycisphaerales bacterium]